MVSVQLLRNWVGIKRIGLATSEVAELMNRFGSFLQGRYGHCESTIRRRQFGSFEYNVPSVKRLSFLAPSTLFTGKVEIGEGSSVWNNVSMRADRGRINIGNNVHIQDNVVVVTGIMSVRDVNIANNVVIEPGVTIEPCKIEEGAYICAGATLMEGCRVARGAVIGPKAVLRQFQNCEPDHYYLGRPAKESRPLTPEEKELYRSKREAVIQLAKDYAVTYAELEKKLANPKALLMEALVKHAEHGSTDPSYRPHYFTNKRFQISPDGSLTLHY